MGEFIPKRGPERPNAPAKPENQKNVEAIPITQASLDASEHIAQTLEKGISPSDSTVGTLTSSVDRDLSAAGVHLTDKEKNKWTDSVKNAFRSDGKAAPELSVKESDEFSVNLPEYQKYFSQLVKTYGLDKQTAKLSLIEGLICQGKVISTLAGVSVTSVVMSLISDKAQFPRTGELIGRWIGPKLVPDLRVANASGGTHPVTVEDTHIQAAVGETWGQLRRFKWPVAVALAYIPSVVVGFAGESQLIQAMKPVRQAINDRTANSLFMRDLEFVHDKSAAEINNIVEKGKQSTLQLFLTTFKDVIPRFATIGLATAGQLPFNPIGAGLQFARLPFLYGMSRSYARDILEQRATDLKRKDMIDTRINATLGSLEIVKTSDNMDKAIGDLKNQMGLRDAYQTESQTKELKTGVKNTLYNTAFDWGIPIVSAGLNYAITGKKGKAVTSGALSIFASGIIKSNSQELINIYIDKIQPALQDIKRMEALLGPYDTLDKPDGELEMSRIGVSVLPNVDISVRNLNYKNILHDVSLDIPQGSFVTIKGPSGLGKTTFLRHMLGLFGAGEGQVTYGGTDLKNIRKFGDDSVYSIIGYANQTPQFFENMTLRDNLLLWTKKQIPDERVIEVLHDLKLDHITDRLDSTVKHFSGGELRRIGIARALLKDPKVLFLDEPTANLDEDSAKQVLDIIRIMRKTRPDMTVVAITHDPNFEAIAEKIVDFREINKPKVGETAGLGNRQVLYAQSDAK